MNGIFSLGQAARYAEMHVREFFELMRERGIESNITLEDFKESLKHAKRLTGGR